MYDARAKEGEVKELEGFNSCVMGLHIPMSSPNTVVSAARDGVVNVWDLRAGKVVRVCVIVCSSSVHFLCVGKAFEDDTKQGEGNQCVCDAQYRSYFCAWVSLLYCLCVSLILVS